MTDQTTTQAATTTEGAASSTPAVDGATAAPENSQQQGAQASADATATQTADTSKTDQPADKQVQGAPESYAFKAPEGAPLDEAVTGAFGDVAKELNLTQEAAQKVIDKVMPVMAQRAQDQVKATRESWATAAKADKEIGGEKHAEALALAKQGRDPFASPELIQLLDESGLSEHPEFIRMFSRIGRATREDAFVAGRTTQSSDARNFYSASNMNP